MAFLRVNKVVNHPVYNVEKNNFFYKRIVEKKVEFSTFNTLLNY